MHSSHDSPSSLKIILRDAELNPIHGMTMFLPREPVLALLLHFIAKCVCATEMKGAGNKSNCKEEVGAFSHFYFFNIADALLY